MADPPDLAAVWRRAADANLRYYREWGRLATTWMSDVRAVAEDLAATGSPDGVWSRVTSQAEGAGAGGDRPSGGDARRAPDGARGSVGGPAPALVLEAEGGASAAGAFLVENGLGHPVEAVVTADPFPETAGSSGLDVALDPTRIRLGAGESTVVRVTVTVPADLPLGDHHTTVRVPDLVGTAVGLVVRRLEPAG